MIEQRCKIQRFARLTDNSLNCQIVWVSLREGSMALARVIQVRMQSRTRLTIQELFIARRIRRNLSQIRMDSIVSRLLDCTEGQICFDCRPGPILLWQFNLWQMQFTFSLFPDWTRNSTLIVQIRGQRLQVRPGLRHTEGRVDQLVYFLHLDHSRRWVLKSGGTLLLYMGTI